ncbi:MAG: DUF3365 domain-containing protein [Nitrospinae bacterium]|nr:DUF3365 domain-containing protein [Nitrospinota bacterium]
MRKPFAAITAILMTASLAMAEVSKEEAVEKSKEMVKELGGSLKGKLQETVKESGFTAAINVCKEIGLTRAKQVGAKYNASIRRVSVKNRNAANVPDDYEAAVLNKMEKDKAEGKLQEAYVEVVSTGGKKNLRFMKPIITEALCLNCHGTADKLNPEAAQAIKANYPDDKATGYGADQLRGAFSVVYPLY